MPFSEQIDASSYGRGPVPRVKDDPHVFLDTPTKHTCGDGSHRVRVALIISSLEHGGAERQVVELVRNIDRRRFDPIVVSLSRHTPLASGLLDPGRELVVIEKRWMLDYSVIRRLARFFRRRRIDVAHCFLFDAEAAGRIAAKIAGVPVVIASERNTDYRRPLHRDLFLRLTRRCADAMIANSHSGKAFNIRSLGLSSQKIHVVHNGVDTERFRPSTDGDSVRRSFGINSNDYVVGIISSFKRHKRHRMFFEMAKAVTQVFPRTWFLCVGEPLRDNFEGAADYHREMRELVHSLGITERCLMLGARDDMPTMYGLCDLTVLTSSREGTPNVLLESMACGVPVVATDIADNAHIVRDGAVGFLVGLDDMNTLIDRVCTLLGDTIRRKDMGRAARYWVAEQFSLNALARQTESVYTKTLRAKERAAHST